MNILYNIIMFINVDKKTFTGMTHVTIIIYDSIIV